MTASAVSCVVPSPEAPTEVPPCCERRAVTAQCTEELELTDDRHQKPVRPNVGQTQVMGIGYRDEDEESVEFFDGLSATVCGDKEYIRVHLGRHSCRRMRAEPYGLKDGALTFKGKPVDDGGYQNGWLKNKLREEKRFGPGCKDKEVSFTPEEKNELAKAFDELEEDLEESEKSRVTERGSGDVRDASEGEKATAGSSQEREDSRNKAEPIPGFTGRTPREAEGRDEEVKETEETHSERPRQDQEEARECEPKRMMTDPGLPTQKEVDEHEIDHVPYRSWCPHCVK